MRWVAQRGQRAFSSDSSCEAASSSWFSSSPGSRSKTKNARVVASVSRVRTPWRQFQRRQVTPASSRQTISPGRGAPSWPSKSSSPLAIARRSGPLQVVEVLAADGRERSDADGVVEVDEHVHARQAPALEDARGQRFGRARVLAGLGAERRERGAPRGDVRVIGRAGQPARAQMLLGLVEHGRAVVVARPVADAFGEHDQRDVLGVSREDVAVDGWPRPASRGQSSWPRMAAICSPSRR